MRGYIQWYCNFIRPSFWGAAGAVAGATIGGLFGRKGAKDQNAANAQEAEANRAFQAYMAGTAHEREMIDLRRAGLNPILTATGGPGAATPGGSMARMENVNEALASSARDVAMQTATIQNLKEQNEQIKADTVKKVQESWGVSAKTELDKRMTDLIVQQEKTEVANTRAAEHQAAILSNAAKGAELEGEIDETRYGAIMRYINRAVRAVTGGASAAHNLRLPNQR